MEVIAFDLGFEPAVIDAPAETEMTVHLVNTGAQLHNIAFHRAEGGEPLAQEAIGPVIAGGESTTLTFRTPPAGEYFFVCSVHPLDMRGTLRIADEGGDPGLERPPSPSANGPQDHGAGQTQGPDGASDVPALVLARDPRIDTTAFRVTTFAEGLPYTTAMQELDDGSLLVAVNEPQGGGFLRSTGKLVRLRDLDDDGVADLADPVGVVGPLDGRDLLVYQDIPGAIVQMRRHRDLLFVTSRRQQRSNISILRVPRASGAPLQVMGQLVFAFPEAHLHDTYSLALRDGPDGAIELYFNVGSRLESRSDPTPVEVSGLIAAELVPESVYRVTLRDDGASLVAEAPELVAIGLRNAAGMDFHPRSGDLYLQDNGMSRADDPDESLSADELNVIRAEELHAVSDFGWSDSWTAYRTGELVGARGTPPFIAFQPLDGAESEGAAEITFAPPGFPDGLDDGLFVGFHGNYSEAGVENEENPLVYVDVDAATYVHFVPNDIKGIGHLDNVLATADSLFIADLNREGTLGTARPEGAIYQVKAIE